MRVLSLFDGMGCGYEAFKRADIPVTQYLASEIDTHAMKIAKKNHPDIIHIGSVTDIKTTWWEEHERPDILIGGSPCQSFSFAGKMAGMTTTCGKTVTTLDEYMYLKTSGFQIEGRSYLFWEYIRCLKELKPKWFLLENVVMKKNWEDIISDTLGVKPIMINSRLVSAQQRKRLYWTNIPDVQQPSDYGVTWGDIRQYGEKKPLLY